MRIQREADLDTSPLQGSMRNSTLFVNEASALREYLQLLLFFFLLAVLLAVFSYQPTDPSSLVTVYHFEGTHVEPRNLFGPAGADLSEWLYQLLGLLAPVGLVIGILQVVEAVLRHKPSTSLIFRLYGLVQFLAFSSIVIDITVGSLHYKDGALESAGWVGHALATQLMGLLGPTGAVLTGAFGVISALPMLVGLRVLSLVWALVSWVPLSQLRAFALALTDSESRPSLGSKGATRISAEPEPKAEEEPVEPAVAWVKSPQQRSPEAHSTGQSPVVLPRRQMEQAKELNAADIISRLSFHASEGQNKRREEEKLRLIEEAQTLVEKLETFGVCGRVTHSQPGPVVNVHEFEPAPGVKVGKVLSLQEDLALGLRARSVIMAPQAGKSTIGIELPAHYREIVSLREVISSSEFQSSKGPLPMVLGKCVDGSPLIADLSAMPHLLVAGSTGSGKSVAINVILLSLLLSKRPEELRLILVDPKMLELSNYDGIGHLLLPVVTQPEKAAGALKWVIAEMERRYNLLKECQVRNIQSYHGLSQDKQPENLPYIVVVIDELCDLMMTAPKDVEDSVQRLAQKARAAGIHLILATQRPSVDVLTGVIKANLPCRISFQVASKHDSRTIIEAMGAEKLLGKGDMLYLPPGTSKLRRAHCAFVSDEEVNEVCGLLSATFPTQYEAGVMTEVDTASQDLSLSDKKGAKGDDFSSLSEEELYERAVDFAISAGKVSTSSVQRHFRIGYNKAARLMDRMDREGLVGPSDVAGKPREVLGRNQ